MTDRPMTRRPQILMLPGASLMDVHEHASGALRVRCPGCGGVATYHPQDDAEVSIEPFVHEQDDCPVLAQIAAALARLAAADARIEEN